MKTSVMLWWFASFLCVLLVEISDCKLYNNDLEEDSEELVLRNEISDSFPLDDDTMDTNSEELYQDIEFSEEMNGIKITEEACAEECEEMESAECLECQNRDVESTQCLGGEDEVECKIRHVQNNIEHFFERGFSIAEAVRRRQDEAVNANIRRGYVTSKSVLMQYRVKRATTKAKLISDCGAAKLQTSILVAQSLNLSASEIPAALSRITLPRQLCQRTLSACNIDDAETLRQAPVCPQHVVGTPKIPEYRTIDGICNNKASPYKGAANTFFSRMVPPAYDNGVNSPRMAGLPNCRAVSRATSSVLSSSPSTLMTQMVKQWGQFLDHDMVLTPEAVADDHDGDGEPDHLPCCDEGSTSNAETSVDGCLPIDVTKDDYYTANQKKCLRFVRSLPGGNGASCNLQHREQFNLITSYIDGSNVYGSDSKVTDDLRSGQGGKLRTSIYGETGICATSCKTAYLPETGTANNLFLAGDIRVNEQPALTSMHTIWMRYHNKICDELEKYQSSWDDDRIFYEARRIVGAVMQQITYGEFLPMVLSSQDMKLYGLNPLGSGAYNSYDPTMDPTPNNVFATAAFRFGHSLIGNNMKADETDIPLCNHFFNNAFLKNDNSHPSQIIQGEAYVPAEKIDMGLVDTLTNKLFAPGCTKAGNDLMALNCQRARDHGLPSFNEYRVACGLSRYSWSSLTTAIGSTKVNALRSVYKGSVDQLDIFIGGLAESPSTGTLLGPTFSCILGKQFQALKKGDRFYYENNLPEMKFSTAQRDAIRRTTLASVICDVTTMRTIPKHAMEVDGSGTDSCIRNLRDSVARRLKYYWNTNTYDDE